MPPEGLQAVIDIEDQSVSGRFRSLRFEARVTGEGQATATFERVEGMTLVSKIESPRRGTLTWRGTTLDGSHTLSQDELEAVAHYADRLKVDELALIPLDLACQPGAQDLDPAVGAAILQPWQMLLYSRSGESFEHEVQDLASRSICSYLGKPLDARVPKGSPSPSIVMLGFEQPLPMAYGYFPFRVGGDSE